MTTTHQTTAIAIGEYFASLVRDFPAARQLWVRDNHDVELWLLIDPVDRETRHAFYTLSGRLYNRFSTNEIMFHLINPEDFEPFNIDDIIPEGATPIALR